jgi:hypothetical protein
MEQTDAQDHSSLYVPTELMVASNLELSSYWTLTTDTHTRSQATGLETSTGVGPISFCLPLPASRLAPLETFPSRRTELLHQVIPILSNSQQ